MTETPLKPRNLIVKTSYDEYMCDIFHKWLESRKGVMGDLGECYEFAKANEMYAPRKWSERRIFKMEMSKSISRERIPDEQGNPIRRNHVLRVRTDGAQLYLWGEMMKMKPAEVKLSLTQRVHGLGSRAVQIERDKTYYNQNNKDGARVELDYDLNLFVENAKNPTEYPDERPDDEE